MGGRPGHTLQRSLTRILNRTRHYKRKLRRNPWDNLRQPLRLYLCLSRKLRCCPRRSPSPSLNLNPNLKLHRKPMCK